MGEELMVASAVVASASSESIFQQYAPLFSLMGAIFGGIGLSVANNWLQRSKDKRDYGTELRGELREENKELRDENRDLRNEIDSLRVKYLAALTKIEEMTSKGDS
jgi:cell division protein FtsB